MLRRRTPSKWQRQTVCTSYNLCSTYLAFNGAGQNRITDAQLTALQRQKVQIQSALEKISAEKDEAEQKVARLAYSRKDEIDPYDYEQFLIGVKALTPMEHTIFNYYLEGKSVKEIVLLADIKESTVRFHNRNIYSKLCVKSLKQLLLFAAIMKQDKEGGVNL